MDQIERERAEGEPWNYEGETAVKGEEGSADRLAELLFASYFAQFENTTKETTEMIFSTIRQSVVWYGSILAAWSIPLNLLVLAVLLVGLKRTRSVTSGFLCPAFRWLMVNFTVVQLIMSCFVIPLNVIADKKGSWIFGGDLCRVWLLAQLALVANTFWTLFAMTFDRFLDTVASRFYGGWSSSRFASLVLVLGSWVISGLALVPSLIIQSESDFILEEVCATSINPEQSLFVTLAAFGVPVALALLVMGAMIFARLRLRVNAPYNDGYKATADDFNHHAEGHHSNRSSTTTEETGSDASVDGCCSGNDVRALFAVCVSCLLTWIPFYVISVVIPFCGGHVCVDPALWSISIWVGYSTSGLAPMFWFIDPWIRDQVHDVFRGKTSTKKSTGVYDTNSDYSFQTNSSKKSLTRAT